MPRSVQLMCTSLVVLPLWISSASAQEATESTEKTGTRVLVLPYQPIFRSVPQGKIQTATDLLNKELQTRNGIVVVRGGVAAEGQESQVSLEEAGQLLNKAEKLEAERRIGPAIEARRSAIASMEKNAAAIENAVDYVLAHHELARALFWAAKDSEANLVLETAARMKPTLELEPTEFSRLYRSTFRGIAEKVLSERRGELMVSSNLPGAKVSFDGRAMDAAPVLLKKAVPGKHLLQARLDGVPPFAAVVEVKAGKKSEFAVSFGNTMGGSSVGAVADALAKNRIPKAAVQSAAKAGRDAGAKFVVAGAMARDEDKFRVHTFVVDVGASAISSLDVVNFDLELLTAESDVLRVVQAIDKKVTGFSGGEPAVATIDKRIREQSTVNEVNAEPPKFAEKSSSEEAKGDKTSRRVFQPLKGGTITIKDEED